MSQIPLIPVQGDLPGIGWYAPDDGFASDDPSDPAGEIGELFDCVGPDFPEDRATATAASPHFVRRPRQLIHGFGVTFADDSATDIAHGILTGRAFVECLGRSVAAGFELDGNVAELLAIDVAETDLGHRVQFTGGDADGIRPVHLDIVSLRIDRRIGMLWCGDTPEPFPADEVAHVVDRIRARAAP